MSLRETKKMHYAMNCIAKYCIMVIEEARRAIEEMRTSSAKNGLSDMSLEGINKEIRNYREGK